MTMNNPAVAAAALNADAFAGKRKEGFNTVSVIGVVGAVAGAVASYAEGSSAISCAAGAIVGGAAGAAFGVAIGGEHYESASAKILGGAASACFGISIGGITTGLINSMTKLHKAESGE